MSDELRVSIDPGSAQELSKLFEGLVKVATAADKLASSGKSLDQLRQALGSLGKSGSAFAELSNSIRALEAAVQGLPTQLLTAMKGAEALPVSVKKGMDGAVREVQSGGARMKSAVRQEIAQLQAEYEKASAMPGIKFKVEALQNLKTSGVSLFPEHRQFLADYLRSQRELQTALREADAKAAAERARGETLSKASLATGKFNTAQYKAQLAEEYAAKLEAEKAAHAAFLRQLEIINKAGVNRSSNTFGSAPVGQVSNIKTGKVSLDIEDHTPKLNSMATAMEKLGLNAGFAHSGIRGLASGFGAMFLTYGQILPLLAGAGISHAFTEAVKQGADLEHTMRVIQHLGEESALSVGKLKIELLEIARSGPFGPREVAEAMKILSLAGLQANEIIGVTRDVLNFSVAGDTGIQQAADTLVSVTTAFGTGSAGFARAGDVIAKTAAVSKASVESISESFKTASVINAQYGVSMEDVGTGLAALAQLGIKGTAAGVALRNMYVDLSGRTPQVTKLLQAQGLELRNLATGGFKDLVTVVGEVREKMQSLDAIGQKNFLAALTSERGAKPLVELLRMVEQAPKNIQAGFDNALKEMRNGIEESYGFAAAASINLLSTSKNIMKATASSLQAALQDAFTEAQPAVNLFFLELTRVFKDPSFISFVSSFVNGVATIGVVLLDNIKLLSAAGTAWVALRLIIASMATSAIPATASLTGLGVAGVAAGAGGQAAAVGLGVAGRALAMLVPVIAVATAAWLAYEFIRGRAGDTDKRAAEATKTSTIGALQDDIKRMQEKNALLEKGVLAADLDRVQADQGRFENATKAIRTNVDAAIKAEVQAQSELAALRTEGAKFINRDTNIRIAEKEKEVAALGRLTAKAKAQESSELDGLKSLEQQHREVYKRNAELLAKQAPKAMDIGNLPFGKSGRGAAFGGGAKGDGIIAAQDKMESAALQSMIALYAKQTQVAEKAHSEKLSELTKQFADEKQLLDAQYDAKIIDEGQYYAKSLQQTLESEKKRTDLITAYKDSAVNGAKGQQEKIAKEFPGIADVAASSPDELGKVPTLIQKAAAAYRELDEKIKQVTETSKHELAVMAQAANQRRQLAAIGLDKKLNAESAAYEKLNDSLTEAIAKEQALNDAAHIRSETSERDGKMAAARQGFEAKFTAEFKERERVLASLTSQQEALNAAAANPDNTPAQLAEFSAGADKLALGVAKLKTELERLKGETTKGAALAADTVSTDLSRQAQDQLDEFIGKGKTVGQVLSDGFGQAGKALAGLIGLMQDYGNQQEANERKRKELLGKEGDFEKRAKINSAINAKSERETIEMYVGMAGAAKGFFNENSRGYKALQAAETTYRAVTLAGNLAVGISTAVLGVAKQASGGDVYTAIPRMAAMAAVMAGLGYATGFFGGSGGGTQATTAQRQGGAGTGTIVTAADAARSEANGGFGTVLGDGNAKSESITKALEALKDIDSTMLKYSGQMANSLKNIENSLGGLASMIFRTTGLTTGKNLGITTGTLAVNHGDPLTNALGMGLGKVGQFAEKLPLIGGIVSTLHSLWGKTTQKISDSGLSIGGKISDLAQGQGVQQYADVATTTSSFFGLKKSTKDSTQFGALGGDIATQFGMIFASIGTTLQSAAGALGKDTKAVAQQIADYVVDIPRLSLLDLKGQDLQDAISAAISSASDAAAAAALPGFKDFQKVGEGYFETVIRVATGVEQAQSALDQFNISAIAYTDIIEKQGDVAAEIVKLSLVNTESVNGVLTGVGDMLSMINGSAEEIAAAYKSFLDLRKAMALVGMDGMTLSASLVRSAGGVEKLQSSLGSYFDGYFTESEQLAAKTEAVRKEFAAIGYELPTSRAQLRQWIEASGTATEEGSALTAKLLGLTGAFADLVPVVEKVSTAVQDAIAANIGKFQTPEQRTRAQYESLDATLAKNGVNVDLGRLMGLSKTQIFDYTAAIINSGSFSEEAQVAIINVAGSLADLRDQADSAAAALNKGLNDAIDNNIDKFLTPKETVTRKANVISSGLAGLGLEFSPEQLLGYTKAQIYDYAKAFVLASENSVEAKTALVNFAGSLMDLKDTADGIRIDELQGQLDLITATFGDLSVIDTPVKNLSQTFVEARDNANSLQKSLDDMLGKTAKTIQETLGDLLSSQKSLQTYRAGLADTIEETRLRTLSPSARISAMKAQEASLFGQLSTAEDPAAVAQKLTALTLSRIKEEAGFRKTLKDSELSSAELQAKLAQKARDSQIETLKSQIDGFQKLKGMADELARFTSSLKFGDNSPLAYADQLGEARKMYESTLAKAQGGDATAMGNLQGDAKAYLDEARSYYASSAGYASIFSQVVGSVDALSASGLNADPQIAALQEQLDQLEALNSTVEDTSGEELVALTAIQAALGAREDANQAKIDKQIKLAEDEIQVQREIAESSKAQIAQWAAIAAALLAELNSLNGKTKANLDINSLLSSGSGSRTIA